MCILDFQETMSDAKSDEDSEHRRREIEEKAVFYTKNPKKHEQAVNKAAGALAVADPTLLVNRGNCDYVLACLVIKFCYDCSHNYYEATKDTSPFHLLHNICYHFTSLFKT